MSTVYTINPSQPSVVGFTRFEPVAIDPGINFTIRAQVHDAMWMLTQQWRMGEFKGTDGGTASTVKLAFKTALINRFQHKTGLVIPYLHDKPLEAEVEKLPLIPDLMLRMQMGKHWFKLCGTNVSSAVKANFRNQFPIELPGNDDYLNSANVDAIQVIRSAGGKVMDGYAFYQYLTAGSGNTALSVVANLPPAPTANEETAINAAETEFKNWFKRLFYQPEYSTNCWSAEQLTYNFKTSAPLQSTNGAAQSVLLTDRHKSGVLDWYDFTLSANNAEKLNEVPANSISNTTLGETNTNIISEQVTSYIPTPVQFKGMPVGRWWEFEDKNIDLATIMTQKSDITKLMLMEFGLIYSNDWMIIPHTMPVGALAEVTGMVVTDVFGTKTVIKAAGTGLDDTWQRWSMYTLNKLGEDASAADNRLFIPPSAVKKVEGEAIEKVIMLRDEMANMVWGLEETVLDGINAGKPGKYAEFELMRYLKENEELIARYDAPLEETTADIAFKLSNNVPENWIPFIPVKTGQSNRDIQFRRAKMRRIVDGFLTNEYVRPRTSILSVGIEGETVNQYTINEEEILRQGATIKTNYQRARWYDGSIYTWLGRERLIGKGEGSSGLQFDQIVPKETVTPDAVSIPWPTANLQMMYWDANPNSYPASGTMIKDISGNGNHGALTGFSSPGTATSGYYNGMLNYDGLDDNIIFDNAWLDNKTEFSFYTVFNIGNSPNAHGQESLGILGPNSGGCYLLANRLLGTGTFWAPVLFLDGTLTNFYAESNNGNISPFTITDLSSFYHFAFTVKDGEICTYVNGALCHQAAVNIGSLDVANQFQRIGRYGSVQYYSGQIPVTLGYDRAITQQEVEQIYNYFNTKY